MDPEYIIRIVLRGVWFVAAGKAHLPNGDYTKTLCGLVIDDWTSRKGEDVCSKCEVAISNRPAILNPVIATRKERA